MKMLLLAAVRAYRYFIGPMFPPACRFHPSCSEYAEEALAQHGAWHGSLLSARRLCRCHPWHQGGFDPVPAPDAVADLARGRG